jgi:hypothetical protein
MTRTIAILGIIAMGLVLGSAIAGSHFYFGVLQPKTKVAAKPAYVEHCVGRVVYLQFETAVVTKLKPDGKVWTCGGV